MDGNTENTLLELAKAACAKHGTIDEATAFVWRRVSKLDGFPAALKSAPWLEPIVKSAIQDQVYDVRHTARRVVKHSISSRLGTAALEATRGVAVRSLLDMVTTPNGTPIGDVLGGELAAYANQYREIARGSQRNAAFFDALAAIVPADKLVRDAVSTAKAEAIYRQATGEGIARQRGRGRLGTRTVSAPLAA